MPMATDVEHQSDLTLEGRLAASRDADEMREILGKRRIATYSAVCLVITLALLGVSTYLGVAVILGRQGLWVIGWLVPLLFLLFFVGSISYGDTYERVTGRPKGTPGFIRVLSWLNRDI
jgi:p-aminobenzoyl-glutamate transporter AbgT